MPGALIRHAIGIQLRDGGGVTQVTGVDPAPDRGRILRLEGREIVRHRMGRLRSDGERDGEQDCYRQAAHMIRRRCGSVDHGFPPWNSAINRPLT
jgi:hypothetical protein